MKDDDFVFASEKEGKVVGEQFSPASLSVKFNRIVQKLKIDKSTAQPGKPKKVRLHGLRKYFFNNMKADESLRKFWMGHSLGVDAHYISRDVERHREEYKKGYAYLRIYDIDPVIRREDVERIVEARVEERVKDLSIKVEELENMLRRALTSGFEKRLTKEAAEDLLKRKGLEKHPKIKKEWVSEG